MNEHAERRAWVAVRGWPAQRWLWFAVAWAGLYLVLSYVLTHAFPVADDFDVLRSLNRIDEQPDDAWFYLSAQHHEHRIVLARLVFLGVAAVLSTLSLKLVALLGNLALLTIPLLYARARSLSPGAIPDASRWHLTLATVVLLTFNGTTAENMLFPMAAVSNHGVVAFSVAAVAAAVVGGGWLVLAWTAAVAATFTSIQGALVWPVLLVLLAAERRWRALAVTAAVSAGALVAFFGGYVLPDSAQTGLTELPIVAVRTLLVGLSILGSFLGIPGRTLPVLPQVSMVLSVGLGVAIVVVLVRFLRRGTDGSVLARLALWTGVFEVLVSFAIGFGRQSVGLEQGLASRYHLHSIVALIAVLVLLEVHRGQPRVWRLPAAGSRVTVQLVAVLAVLSLAFPLYFHRVTFGPAGRDEIVHPRPDRVEPILQEAIERGIFTP